MTWLSPSPSPTPLSSSRSTSPTGRPRPSTGSTCVSHRVAPWPCSVTTGPARPRLIRVMTTSRRPDRGRVVIDGVDAIEHPHEVRRRIGVTGQYAGLDDFLTTLREPRAHRSPGRPARRGPRPRQGSRRPVRAARHRRPPGGRAVGRDTAPSRSRRQPGRLTGRPVPRRAHHRARPRCPSGAVGGGRRAHRRRHHGGAHHPVPRRGRPARRPGGRPRPRPHRRPAARPPS